VCENAINAPELTSFFIEEPPFLRGRFDNATSHKCTTVLIRGRVGAEPVKEVSTYVTLSSYQYS
jgi:hypothetical protein